MKSPEEDVLESLRLVPYIDSQDDGRSSSQSFKEFKHARLVYMSDVSKLLLLLLLLILLLLHLCLD